MRWACLWQGCGRSLGPLGIVAVMLSGVVARASAMPPQVVERDVRVGRGTVHALCTSGPHQALILHDDGEHAVDWRSVLEQLEGKVGACAYDRVRLDEDSGSRGWFELLDDLRRAHVALGFRDGYTLVGHGLGGLYARLYAADRPTDVAGMVLVDPAHEDLAGEVQRWMPHPTWEDWMQLSSHPNSDGVRETDLARRARTIRQRDMPVTVITAMRRRDLAGNERFLNEAARRVHASILQGVTNARHVPADRSGHEVQLDEPELVAREIERVVRLTTGWDE